MARRSHWAAPMSIVLGVAIGLSLLVGAALGLLGGGGSLLMVPILVYVVGLRSHDAIATSLLVVAATSAAALVPHARAGRVQVRTGAMFGGASMIGAYAGGHVSRLVPGDILLVGFGVVMMATAVAMLVRRERIAATAGPELPELALYGLGVGALTGVLGAGGGFLVVPALVIFGGLPIREAIGTSLLVIAMNAVAGFAAHAGSMTLDPAIAIAVTAAAMIGSVAAASLSSGVRPEGLRSGFGVLVLTMGAFVLCNELPGALGHPELVHAWIAAPLAIAVFSITRRIRERRVAAEAS